MTPQAFGCCAHLYLLCGLTDDAFILPDTRMVFLEQAIEEHLLASGFQLIVFHHPVNGVRETSPAGGAVSSTPSSATPTPPATAKKKPRGLIGGPVGAIRLSSKPRKALQNAVINEERHTPRTEAVTVSKVLTKVGDNDLGSYFHGFINRKTERRAFVFLDADYLLGDIREAVLRNLRAHLRDIARGVAQDAICVFVSQHSGPSHFLAEPHDTRHFFHPLQDAFFGSEGAPRSNVIRIGAPDKEEIRNFQRRLRLIDRCLTNFDAIEQNLDAVVAKIRSSGGKSPDVREMSIRQNADLLKRHDWGALPALSDGLDDLKAMLGRRPVYERIRDDIEDAQFVIDDLASSTTPDAPATGSVNRIVPQASSIPHHRVDLNYALIGNPGTGKTVIARKVGQAFKEAGLLSSGHFIEAKALDFVAGHMGGTEEKTAALLDSALGGTIFIDEVQSFDPNETYHRTAVKALLTYLESRRGELSIIFATYPQHFQAFLEFDPGLERRIAQRIELDDYDEVASAQIFRAIAAQKNLQIDAALDERLEDVFSNWIHDRKPKSKFANGGSIDRLVTDMQKRARREGGVLKVTNVPEDLQSYLIATGRSKDGDTALDEAMAELDNLVGLSELKDKVRKVVQKVKAAKMRGEPIPSGPGHFSFEGAPGTGKTTAARLMGDIFRSIGVLKSGHVEEVDRQQLVSRYQGGTAHEVDEVVARALDGVLFIDEAHNLSSQGMGNGADSYGQEAIGTLTNRIENNRDRLCVILAGYTREMDNLFLQDPGWNSRISHRIKFANYTAAETAQILRLFAGQEKRTLSTNLDGQLETVAAKMITLEAENFANGRSARNLLAEMLDSLDDRILNQGKECDSYELTIQDIPRRFR